MILDTGDYGVYSKLAYHFSINTYQDKEAERFAPVFPNDQDADIAQFIFAGTLFLKFAPIEHGELLTCAFAHLHSSLLDSKTDIMGYLSLDFDLLLNGIKKTASAYPGIYR
jgi:hypothetical protein